ncbi:MAG: MJ0042-type zinc finger domain-containing protein [Thermodesulfobacteriota bacterium]
MEQDKKQAKTTTYRENHHGAAPRRVEAIDRLADRAANNMLMAKLKQTSAGDNGGGTTEAACPPVHFPLTDPLSSGLSPASVAAAFSPASLDEHVCRLWLLSSLHPAGAVCPSCDSRLDVSQSRRFWAGKKLRCKTCGAWFTALTGTPLSGSKLDYRQVYLLAVLTEFMAMELTPARVAEIIGVSADTVRFWIKKFRLITGG